MGKNKPSGSPGKGIYRKTPQGSVANDAEQRVAEFSYQNDALADLIVKLWSDTPGSGGLYDKLTKVSDGETKRAKAAKDALGDRGIHLMRPLVITETEYYDGYTMEDPAGVVFVLPDAARADTAKPLLEAAKLLMACTPNGI